MKKTFLTLSVAFLSILILSSCLEKKDEKFEIIGSGYVMQKASANGDAQYVPYLFVTTSVTENELASVEIANSEVSFPMQKVTDYEYVSNPQPFNSIVELNGTYYVTATSKKGERVTDELKLNFSKEDYLGDVEVKDFTYDGTTIKLKVKPAENAIATGICINRFDDKVAEYMNMYEVMYYESESNGTLVEQAGEDCFLAMKLSFASTSYDDMMLFDNAQISAFALTNNAVYRTSDIKKVITKDAQGF